MLGVEALSRPETDARVVDAPSRRGQLAPQDSLLSDGAAIDCVVRNLSETGAALAVETPVGIPPRFSLLVDSDGIKRASRIVWRNQLRIGVKFDDGDGRS